jgi:hypothetical protein
MESCAPMTGLYWFLVKSNSISEMPFSAVDPPIGAQDSNQLSKNWRPGNNESGNEHLYTRSSSQDSKLKSCKEQSQSN